MKKTLQDQYLLIKEGKGHKGVFLTEAKRQFPNIVRNAATFEEAASSLKTKNIISENVIGLTAINSIFEPKKKESYEVAYEAFLAEAKKKENEDEKVKAEEKKVSKKVEEDYSHNYDQKDNKNIDNLIFDQVMTGYYAEMKDPKNADKTMQELKDIVMKNLQKDPIFYTKDGQFGVKDLGYTMDAPGLGEPKEAKGKWKASGYGDLKESIQPINEEESKLRKVIREMIGKELKNENSLGVIDNDVEPGYTLDLPISYSDDKNVAHYSDDDRYSNQDDLLDPEDHLEQIQGMSDGDAFDYLGELGLERDEILTVLKSRKSSLREIEEAYQLVNINLKTPKKDREDRDPTDKYLTFDKDFEKDQKRKGNIIVKDNDRIFLTKVLHANLGPNSGNSDLRRHLMDRANLEPAVLGGQQVWKIKGAKINSKGNISVFVPVEKSSIKESVEKELAAINKEAEHEIISSKLEKVQALIDKKQSQLTKLDEDEEMKDLTDAKKVKEISKDIKSLEKAKIKLEKIMNKGKGKAKLPKKEVIDEMDMEPSEEYMSAKEDAENRYDEGEEIDSIISTYHNLSFEDRELLRRDLEGKMNGMDY